MVLCLYLLIYTRTRARTLLYLYMCEGLLSGCFVGEQMIRMKKYLMKHMMKVLVIPYGLQIVCSKNGSPICDYDLNDAV